MSADHVVCFDGVFETALRAFQEAGEEPVLFIVDSTDAQALVSIGRARAAGVSTHALTHSSHLGPLGRTVLTQLAAALAQQTDAGTVLAALREIEDRTRTFVIVDSPAKLQRPTPSLWQHAWGLLPGTCFIGELTKRVTAVGRRGLPPALEESLRSPHSILHTTDPESTSHRANVLAQTIEAVSPWRHVPHEAADPAAAKWWGPAHPLELCAVPADITGLVRSVLGAATRCTWCGLTAVGDTCSVCGSSVPAAGDALRTAHRGAPAPTPAHPTVEGQLA